MVPRKSGSCGVYVRVNGAMGMILLLVISAQAFHIVDTIAFSIISANTIGFIFWVYLSNKLKSQPQPKKSSVSGAKIVASNEYIT